MGSDQRNTTLDGLGEGLQRMRSINGRTTGPTRRSTKGQWTAEEDEILCQAVQRFKGKNWKKIAECFKDRTDVQCLHRWQKVLNPELVKGPWSKEEDEIIVQLVKQYGAKKWSQISQHLPGRIGKQCRERWHNHLNPAINKDAWTQEEELQLIRAHQIYGNKWAELTKFLPGRTDNSIKNHWNSSVKKKLDSYLASGLLDQFQGLPLVSHTNQSSPTRGDDGIFKDSQTEEISECSQSSNFIDCSQSTNEMGNSVRHTRDECQLAEGLGHGKDPCSSPVSCSDNYYASGQEVAFTISEPCELGGSSNFIDNRFSDEWLASSGVNQRPNVIPFSSQTTDGLRASSSMGNIAIVSDVPEHMLIHAEECSRSIYPEDGSDSYYSQCLCIPSQVPPAKGASTFSSEAMQCNDMSVVNQEDFLKYSNDGFFYVTDSSNVHFVDGQDNMSAHKETDETQDSSMLVPADDFSAVQANDFQYPPLVGESHILPSEQQNTGALSYEPPRFPSLDIPFFSCDLIQPGKDMQHEYSPLGMRQVWMSMDFSPPRLWDSPSLDGSPKAVLKSAAKTFSGTPSILKKRHRDLVSPLSGKRCEKKLESTVSNLGRNFSQLEVMFEESANEQSKLQSPSRNTLTSEASIDDKENLCDDSGEVEYRKHSLHNRSSETSDFDARAKDDAYSVDGNLQQSSGVLMEHNFDDLLFFSPDTFGSKSDTPLGLSTRTPRDWIHKTLEAVPNQANISPTKVSVSCKKGGRRLILSSTPSASMPTPVEAKTEDAANVASLENISTTTETPFKRSFDSPSAWKSPWFINSFVPGPKVDTDITIEDIGYYSSPVERRSYDALGLMKQLSEHTASTFANAQEVLGDETPDSILRKRCSEKEDQMNCLKPTSDSLTQGRVLDFSECGTPEKGTESGKSLPPISFSSPSSYLLKGCR